ncbi:hypothetical protein [Brochothrix thermosphacta]|uniref:hypothetical protein n=1 Tax=Brochothrix thermosphacta TaxID=2756 RepID=UPI000D2D72F5|nr:hypothetical protein BTH160X_50219 [Brochothrix thermosphacta]
MLYLELLKEFRLELKSEKLKKGTIYNHKNTHAHFEKNTLTIAIEENNTPVMQVMTTIKGEVEYSHELRECVASEDIINQNSIQSMEITYLNREGSQYKRLFKK